MIYQIYCANVNMDFEEIKKLVDYMGNSKIDELKIEYPDGAKISMKKDKTPVQPIEVPVVTAHEKTLPKEPIREQEKEENFKVVKSPMVGTFYSKSSPKAESFVTVGSKVKKGDILCIVEAMKLMNEIESEFDGEIVEVCVKDGDMVDYGKPLFKIK